VRSLGILTRGTPETGFMSVFEEIDWENLERKKSLRIEAQSVIRVTLARVFS